MFSCEFVDFVSLLSIKKRNHSNKFHMKMMIETAWEQTKT